MPTGRTRTATSRSGWPSSGRSTATSSRANWAASRASVASRRTTPTSSARPAQVKDEFKNVIDLTLTVLKALSFDDFTAQVSLRDPNNTEKYIGEPAEWDAAEQAIREAAAEMGLETVEEEGEAAFYGPKLDFMVKDALGRKWQLGTVQLDNNLPERFDITYVDENDERVRPVMIHRAPFGSLERFVGVMLEHTGGNLPLWLAPVQVKVLPITDGQNDYAASVAADLAGAGLRVEVDTR